MAEDIFSNYPTISYELNGFKTKAVDLFTRFRIADDSIAYGGLFFVYDWKEIDTLENIANRLYDNKPNRSWVNVLANEVEDPRYDFVIDTNTLDKVLEEKYPGVAIFISGAGDFTEGEEVIIDSNANYTGIVYRWDSTLRKVEVIPTSGTWANDDNVDPTTITNSEGTYTIGRIVYLSYESVHHFETDLITGTGLVIKTGVIADPQEIHQQTNTTYIEAYIAGSNTDVVTVKDYEIAENEKKRGTIIVRQELIGEVLTQREGFLNG